MSLASAVKILEEIVNLKRQLSEQIAKEKSAKRRKKFYAKSKKAIKTGKASDLADVRKLLFKR